MCISKEEKISCLLTMECACVIVIAVVGGAKKADNDLYPISDRLLKMSHRSGRGKKKGFGFGGFSLTSSFHKAGELGSWQKERKDDRGMERNKNTEASNNYNNIYYDSRLYENIII